LMGAARVGALTPVRVLRQRQRDNTAAVLQQRASRPRQPAAATHRARKIVVWRLERSCPLPAKSARLSGHGAPANRLGRRGRPSLPPSLQQTCQQSENDVVELGHMAAVLLGRSAPLLGRLAWLSGLWPRRASLRPLAASYCGAERPPGPHTSSATCTSPSAWSPSPPPSPPLPWIGPWAVPRGEGASAHPRLQSTLKLPSVSIIIMANIIHVRQYMKGAIIRRASL